MRSRRAVAEINVVPYIDVMLVLLVIFMVTAPLLMQGVEVDLPKADSSPVSDSDAEPLIVSIDAQAKLYLNLGASDDQALSMETVKQRVATVLKRNPEKAVMVWGDAAVPYGEVVVLMSELQEAGAPSVGLVTEAPARR
ncbi:MAG: protein TolR [Pseudomonadota bacterium]|nr:protein TolR [Pseudomonadota bacterium]MEC7149875.1 protein TolR [Pseudomonadota bacterium]MEC7492547.1 protein TolR [Pseudomonadota bacterium]MEC8167342.1 protein TolR [Pseudomonadota bacterium]MEC8268268.1 protein TolR [Pseudomonadota bacterium]